MTAVGPWQVLLRLLVPTRCVVCDELGPEVVCLECDSKVQRIGSRCCTRCGRLRLTAFASPDCGECHGQKLGVVSARSTMVYNATGRELLAAFKFKGNLGAGQYLVNQAQMAMPEGWSTLFGACEDPVIVPVPLHGKRLRHRGFNQSEFIANRLGRTTSSTVLRGCLIRNRETHTQVGLTANQRRENVRGAFEVPEARKSAIMGRSALLVDDLMTTGSTLGACGVALRRAGAGKVYAFTLFSTVKSVEEHSG